MTKELSDRFNSLAWHLCGESGDWPELFGDQGLPPNSIPPWAKSKARNAYIEVVGEVLSYYCVDFPPNECRPDAEFTRTRSGDLVLYTFNIRGEFHCEITAVVTENSRKTLSCEARVDSALRDRARRSREYNSRITNRPADISHANLVSLIKSKPHGMMVTH
jgi:hypothetical protein